MGGSVSITLDPMTSSTSLHTLFMAAKQTYGNIGAMEGPQPSPQPSPHPSEAPSLIKGAHLLSVSLPCGQLSTLGTSAQNGAGLETSTQNGGAECYEEGFTSNAGHSVQRCSRDGGSVQRCSRDGGSMVRR